METPTWGDVQQNTEEIIEAEIVEESDEVAVESYPELTREKAEELTGWIRSTKEIITVLLYRAKEGKAHKALGYKDFAEYCEKEFGFSGAAGYRKAIQGEVILALEGHVPEGTEIKISQKDAQEIREMLPVITEKIDEADQEDFDLDAIIDEARAESIALQEISDEEIDKLLESVGEEFPIDQSNTVSTPPAEDSIAAARAEANKQHKKDAEGAPEYDASSFTYEELAAMAGNSVSDPNKVRDFITWSDKLPNAADMAKLFRAFPSDVDKDFIASLPKKLESIQTWIDDFLYEFNQKEEIIEAIIVEDDDTPVIEEI